MFNASNQAFEMTFQNGIRIRATWRSGTYSANRGYSDKPASEDAEVFVYNGQTLVFHGGYVKPDKFAELVSRFSACNPYNLEPCTPL